MGWATVKNVRGGEAVEEVRLQSAPVRVPLVGAATSDSGGRLSVACEVRARLRMAILSHVHDEVLQTVVSHVLHENVRRWLIAQVWRWPSGESTAGTC
jgi:hypothetical protein